MTQVRPREAQQILESMVVARYQMYPEYRDIGIEWLGEIPSHWKIERLKYATNLNPEVLSENTHPDYLIEYVDISNVNALGEILEVQEYRFEDAPSRARRVVRQGDTIISTVRTYLKAIAFLENPSENLIVSTGFAVLRPKPNLHPKFLAYVVQAVEFIDTVVANSTGVSYPAIAPSRLGDLPIWFPVSIDEQRAIAAFLDRQTAKIDALIAKKRELIAALHEKRSAIISHAVTKGLNPDAPMKDSGIEWLGEIPAGWEVVRLKFLLARIDSGFSPDCIDMPAGEGEWGVLKTGCVNGGVFHPEENKTLPIDVDPLPQLEVNIGDVLMSRANGSLDLIGSVALVDKLPKARLLLSDKTFRFRFRQQNCEPKFFVKVMGSSLGREQIKLAVSGAGGLANNIAKSSIMEMRITLPPVCEQREIIEFLRLETSHIAYLIAKAEATIERLQEYRSALISAAVTGRIDVRGEVGVS